MAGQRSLYRKVRGRGSWDFALASVAAVVTLKGDLVESARVVLGGAAPIPWRSEAAEKALVGRKIDASSAAAAAEAAMEGATPLDQNGYKIFMFKGAIAEALLALSA